MTQYNEVIASAPLWRKWKIVRLSPESRVDLKSPGRFLLHVQCTICQIQRVASKSNEVRKDCTPTGPLWQGQRPPLSGRVGIAESRTVKPSLCKASLTVPAFSFNYKKTGRKADYPRWKSGSLLFRTDARRRFRRRWPGASGPFIDWATPSTILRPWWGSTKAAFPKW